MSVAASGVERRFDLVFRGIVKKRTHLSRVVGDPFVSINLLVLGRWLLVEDRGGQRRRLAGPHISNWYTAYQKSWSGNIAHGLCFSRISKS